MTEPTKEDLEEARRLVEMRYNTAQVDAIAQALADRDEKARRKEREALKELLTANIDGLALLGGKVHEYCREVLEELRDTVAGKARRKDAAERLAGVIRSRGPAPERPECECDNTGQRECPKHPRNRIHRDDDEESDAVDMTLEEYRQMRRQAPAKRPAPVDSTPERPKGDGTIATRKRHRVGCCAPEQYCGCPQVPIAEPAPVDHVREAARRLLHSMNYDEGSLAHELELALEASDG